MTTEQKINQCKSIDWYALTNDQLNHILEIAKPEDVPGFCAEHAAMVNAECDRLDKLRNAGQSTDKPA